MVKSINGLDVIPLALMGFNVNVDLVCVKEGFDAK